MIVSHGKYFTEEELMCKCGCSGVKMDSEFIKKLDDLRELYKKPIHLNSAYRCPEYNQKVSSTGPNGPHTTGKAVDIRVIGKEAHKLLDFICMLDFSGIGISQKGSHLSRFIHLDSLTEGTRPWVWSY